MTEFKQRLKAMLGSILWVYIQIIIIGSVSGIILALLFLPIINDA